MQIVNYPLPSKFAALASMGIFMSRRTVEMTETVTGSVIGTRTEYVMHVRPPEGDLWESKDITLAVIAHNDDEPAKHWVVDFYDVGPDDSRSKPWLSQAQVAELLSENLAAAFQKLIGGAK